ncbi:hypothetical protein GCM10012275_63040 [Longimycelium tulufanense]|uniref:Uncharacterized protein n=1 Tax=Longimycelium tulufanense TaxID=907463 RepID=A0A8J3CEN1_9PSEU|nr:hypothetical protein [Longimycelium tulufanense]GGM83811.1 hypothetical protein GCM10012275_63040 [Longimycelium tulufanense]
MGAPAAFELPTASLATARETALHHRLIRAVQHGAALVVGGARTVHRGQITETGDVVPACHVGWCHGTAIRAVHQAITCQRAGCRNAHPDHTAEHHASAVARQLTLDGTEVIPLPRRRRQTSNSEVGVVPGDRRRVSKIGL